MRNKAFLIGIAALAVFAAACSSNPKTKPSPTPTTQAGRLSSPAKISFLSPAPGQGVSGTSVVVRIRLENARIVPRATTQITPTTGHVHISVDGQIRTLYAGLEYTLDNLKPGRHLLHAEFVQANHVPFEPRVTTTVTFTAR